MHAGSVHTPKNCIKKVIFAMCGIGPTQSYLFNRDIFLNFFPSPFILGCRSLPERSLKKSGSMHFFPPVLRLIVICAVKGGENCSREFVSSLQDYIIENVK